MDVDKMADIFAKLAGPERLDFFDRMLRLCSSNDLMYLSTRLDECKRDFVSLLPTEVVDKILTYLDWKDLLSCSQVGFNHWSTRISQEKVQIMALTVAYRV